MRANRAASRFGMVGERPTKWHSDFFHSGQAGLDTRLAVLYELCDWDSELCQRWESWLVNDIAAVSYQRSRLQRPG